MSDQFIIEFDKALRTVFSKAQTSREVPGCDFREISLSDPGRAQAAALMRVNHVGEVCAQALYQGQTLTCRDPRIRYALERAAGEETEHLAWTERRLIELGGRKSLLNPLWYLGALSMGVLAGKFGDAWSLGFLAETERQVETHLDEHLAILPKRDIKSRAIILQMRLDEINHAETAVHLGARELPLPVKMVMKGISRVMTLTAFYV